MKLPSFLNLGAMDERQSLCRLANIHPLTAAGVALLRVESCNSELSGKGERRKGTT